MRKYKKRSHTPLNRTDVVTLGLIMIHNQYLTLMYLLIFLPHFYKIHKIKDNIHHCSFTLFCITFFIFMVPQTVSILTNNQLQFLQHSTMTKVINSLLHLINGNAILLTRASRLRVVLESTHKCLLLSPVSVLRQH